MRLIDADALFEPNENTDKVLIHGGRTGGKTIALAERLMRERVGMAPTITLDDLRPHGRWLVHEGDCEDDEVPGDWGSHEWLCSVCYAEICYEDPMEYRFLPKFCPNCGAKIDLKE